LGSHFFVCMKTKAKIDMWIISNKKLSLHWRKQSEKAAYVMGENVKYLKTIYSKRGWYLEHTHTHATRVCTYTHEVFNPCWVDLCH
jgi:hypothetical protein